MNVSTPKTKYIERIRNQSAYPTLRFLVRLFTRIIDIIAFIVFFGGIVFGAISVGQTGWLAGVLTIIFSVILSFALFVISMLTSELSCMLADIADSILDLNARYE